MATTANRRAGQLVRQLRTDKGWTHEDMSAVIFERHGVNYQTSARTIWRVEGGHMPGVRRQFAIATVLGTAPSKLWQTTGRRIAA